LPNGACRASIITQYELPGALGEDADGVRGAALRLDALVHLVVERPRPRHGVGVLPARAGGELAQLRRDARTPEDVVLDVAGDVEPVAATGEGDVGHVGLARRHHHLRLQPRHVAGLVDDRAPAVAERSLLALHRREA
jgi:hypothetical protein